MGFPLSPHLGPALSRGRQAEPQQRQTPRCRYLRVRGEGTQGLEAAGGREEKQRQRVSNRSGDSGATQWLVFPMSQ